MPASFPTTPRPSRAVGLIAIALGVAVIGLATRTTTTSTQFIGRPFPGFMILDNRVIASVGLGHWAGSGIPGLYQSEILSVNGAAAESARGIYDTVASRPAGTMFEYRLRNGGRESVELIPSAMFTLRDWLLLFGVFLVNGTAFMAVGLLGWVLQPHASGGRALLFMGTTWSIFALSAMDIYGPATLTRLYAVAEALFPAAILHLATLYPTPIRDRRWIRLGHVFSVVILLAYQRSLYEPEVFSRVVEANMTYTGFVGVLFLARLLWWYRRGLSEHDRQRARIMLAGILLGLTVPGVIVLFSAVSQGRSAMNWGTLTPPVFMVFLAYAILKRDLFEIDAMVKRGAYYLLLTGAVGALYLVAVIVFNLVLRATAVTDSPAFPVLFTLVVLLFFNPLRTRLQNFVDRVFFRTPYDGAQVLAAVGGQLASTLKRDRIAALVRDCVDTAIPNHGTRLFAGSDEGGALREIGGETTLPRPLALRLAGGGMVTAFDPAELYADTTSYEMVRAAMNALGAEIAVPLQLRENLVGALTAGPKRSRLFYTAGDAELLRALAHQAAIALENARTYEALVELNARLEERVRERTAQLELANRELADAYTELKTAEVQLVQAEKMASLGRLVAGVAHEINNPVSFIATSVAPLRRRLERAIKGSAEDVAGLLREADELVQIMARGAERTAAIVKDLRSFSRLGEARRKAADLHEGLEVSLRLLEPRWRDRVTVHRDFGALPLVDCDPGQMNQVFMNILANACDAITGQGNVWVTTRHEGGTVRVEIHDDGGGMSPDVMRHIFDPFFTTKDVGSGTGLGLAVSHSVIAAHGGKIEVESTPGHGATFRITVPVEVGGVTLERAVAGSGS